MAWEKIGEVTYRASAYRQTPEPGCGTIVAGLILWIIITGLATKGCESASGAEKRLSFTQEVQESTFTLPRHGQSRDSFDFSAEVQTLLLQWQIMLSVLAMLPVAAIVPRTMSGTMKAFCMAGLISGIGLCVFDWATSIDGFNQVMAGNGDANPRVGFITTFLPITFGTLALAFNATSSYFFALFIRNQGQFTDFTSSVTSFLWLGFVLYDGVSSVIGILSTFSGVTINGLESFGEAANALGPFGTIFGILVAALLALSPFITALFGELIKEHSQ